MRIAKVLSRYTALLVAFCLCVNLTNGSVFAVTSDSSAGTDLICGMEEGEGAHVHTAECYAADQDPICGLDTEGHQHDETCISEIKTLRCEISEGAGHSHTDDCYADVPTLICGLDENTGHQHVEACYDAEGNLICGMEIGDGAHSHRDDCYTVSRELICGEAETVGHIHTDECYEVRTEYTCGLEEGDGAHVHDYTCYPLICGQEESEGHVHTDDCYEPEPVTPIVTDDSAEPVEAAVSEETVEPVPYIAESEDGIIVNAVVSSEADIPEGAVLCVSKADIDSEIYQQTLMVVRDALGLDENDDLFFTPYDVYFETPEGMKIDPIFGTVQVTMQFATDPFDGVDVSDNAEKFVAHVLDDGSVERIEPVFAEDHMVTFEVSSFSVMGPAMIIRNDNAVLDSAYSEIYVPSVPEGVESAVSANTLEDAIYHLADDGVIWLVDDMTIDVITLSGVSTVIKSYDGAVHTLSKDGSAENMFALSDGAALTLENVVIDATNNTLGRTIVASGNSTLTLGEGSVLENNMSHGAVYLDGASLFVTGGTVRNNTATDGNGGAVLVTNGSVFDVTGGNFSGNSAQSGGAVYADVVSQLTVKNAAFENNTAAKADGGAICVENDDKVTMSLSETTFTGNTAANYGGAVRFMAAEPELSVEGCTFTSNTSTDVGGRGGALWLGLTGNDVPADGTGLQASFRGCVFRGNKSTGYGAGKSSNPGIMDYCGGGAVWCESGCSDEISDAVSFNDCQFDANTVAFGSSGAVNAEYIERSSFVGCTMTRNTAPGWGGTVHIVNNSTNPSDILIDGGTFTENHCRTNGGVFNICCFAADITIRGDALFEHNVADQNAGAIYIGRSATRYPERAQECDVKVYMESCRILNNEGNGDLTVDKLVNGSSGDTARMQECERHYHAGAVYVGERCTLYMQDALITGNRIEDVNGDAFGNGITLCPNASAYFYPEHGAAVYDNGSSAGMDILAVPHDEYVHQEGLPRLYICDTTPDGQAYNWTNLNGETARTGEYNWDNALSGISPMSVGDEYQGEATLDPIGFKAHVDGIMTMDLGSEPKVIISGNVIL